MYASFPTAAYMMSSVVPSTPNQAVVVGTLGFCLILIEFNRPGTILPGAIGLLLLLLGIASLSHHPPQAWAVCVFVSSMFLLLVSLRYRVAAWLLVCAALGLCAGLRGLEPKGPDEVALQVALPCGLLSGALSAVLAQIALRARRAKRIN